MCRNKTRENKGWRIKGGTGNCELRESDELSGSSAGTPWNSQELLGTPWTPLQFLEIQGPGGQVFFGINLQCEGASRDPHPPKYFSSPILSHGGLLAIHGSRRSKWHETRCVLQTTMIVCDQKGHAQQFFSLRLS